MKKVAIALVLVIAAVGCMPQKDAEFAFHAPGVSADAPPQAAYAQKPAIPPAKPVTGPPTVLK